MANNKSDNSSGSSVDDTNTNNNNGQHPKAADQSDLREELEMAACDVLKFLYGFSFGYLMWSIIVRPYVAYYDFTFGHHWPELLFSAFIAFVYMLSMRVRCVMVLFLPSLVGNASQNYIIIMLFVCLFNSPITNIGLNAVESIRVIGCSLTITFDALRERAKLMLNPLVEALRSDGQTADDELEPIKRDLSAVQSLVDELRQGAQLAGGRRKASTTTADDDRPLHPLTNRRDVLERIINKTELSLDPANVGLKASIDVDSQLIKLIKQQQLTGGGSSQAPFNLSETLYESCLDIFHDAKQNCQTVLEEMRLSCQNSVGPYFSAVWCSPVIFTFNSACPWLMNQLVDETSICRQLRSPNLLKISWSPKGGDGSDQSITDVNELFSNLTRQLNGLSNELIAQQQQQQQQLYQNNRLELSVTLNEKTRDLFTNTRALIDYITDKYKMRKLLANILLFLYDIYTTYTFLLIIYQAAWYRHNYLRSIRFDNYYITGEFVDLDKRKTTSKKTDESGQQPPAAGAGLLLPLTSDESKRYISTFTCKRRTKEERQYQRASCWMILMFLAFTLSLIYLDNIFYSLLQSIHEHALVRYKQMGHHELDVRVHGTGSLARLVKRLTSRLSSIYDLNQMISSKPCLPLANSTGRYFFLEFLGLVAAYYLIDQISIYAMRLRRLTCAFFYPSKERERIQFLHNFIQYQRKHTMDSYVDDDDDDQVDERRPDENVYTIKEALAYLANCGRSSLSWCWRI